MAKLTCDAVDALLKRVLHTEAETIGDDAVMVKGIIHDYAFQPDRIREAEPEIRALLAQLGDEFQADKGGGMSFLNACMDRHGNHWGEHLNIERLVCLGIGAKAATWIFPRNMWSALPGGMPYVQVNTVPAAVETAGAV